MVREDTNQGFRVGKVLTLKTFFGDSIRLHFFNDRITIDFNEAIDTMKIYFFSGTNASNPSTMVDMVSLGKNIVSFIFSKNILQGIGIGDPSIGNINIGFDQIIPSQNGFTFKVEKPDQQITNDISAVGFTFLNDNITQFEFYQNKKQTYEINTKKGNIARIQSISNSNDIKIYSRLIYYNRKGKVKHANIDIQNCSCE